jgi:hypothetical protein
VHAYCTNGYAEIAFVSWTALESDELLEIIAICMKKECRMEVNRIGDDHLRLCFWPMNKEKYKHEDMPEEVNILANLPNA